MDWTEPEPIEMSVTSDDGPGDGARGWSGDDSPPPAGDRRVLAVATVTGVVALLLGWFIGYTARSDEAAPAAATTTASTEMGETTVVESLPAVPLPATTRPRRTTTTTTLASSVVEAVEIDPRLVGTALTLTGASSNGLHLDLLELDLAESTLTHIDLGRGNGAAEWMIAGDDWVLVVGGNGIARVVRDGEPPDLTLRGEIWENRWDVDTGRFWQPDWDGDGVDGPNSWIEHDIDGEPTGATLEIPFGWVQFVDPRGGLVVEGAGKRYSIDSSGATLIGSGQLLGLSSDLAVFWNCDDHLRCGPEVVDRRTGVVRRLDADSPSGGVTRLDALWGWGEVVGATISPDGEACAVMVASEDGAVLGLLDLESGAVVELGENWWIGMPTVVWSPDARFVFYPNSEGGVQSHLWAYDRESGEAFSVFDEPRPWIALSARPIATDA